MAETYNEVNVLLTTDTKKSILTNTKTKISNKKHLKNVGLIRHNEPPHAHSADVASSTVACRLRIDVYDNANDDNDDDDNA